MIAAGTVHEVPMNRRAAAVLAAALAIPPAAMAAGPRVVRLETKDGLHLEADWYPGEDGMPGIVGLHMYPADRTSWAPLAEARPSGYHFLAIDMRGYGGSRTQEGVDLGARVKSRDPALFNAMWLDAAAGVEFLRGEAKCEPGRIGLAGASVGCSVAIDAAVRDKRIAAVAVFTPGKNYLGVPTMDHLRSWGGAPLLLLSSEEEADVGARPIAEALKDRPGVDLRIVPGEKIHGTNMFGRVKGIEARTARWFEAALGREVLDGRIDAAERLPFDRANGTKEAIVVPRVSGDDGGVNFSYDSGSMDPCLAKLEVFFAAAAGEEDAEGTRRLGGEASGDGTLIAATLATRTAGRWNEEPLGNLPGTAIVRGGILEGRIPWARVGYPGSGEAFVKVVLQDGAARGMDRRKVRWTRCAWARWE